MIILLLLLSVFSVNAFNSRPSPEDIASPIKPPILVYLTQEGQTHSKWRVKNGSPAQLGQFPFVAHLGFCSGSLIAPDVVLTAGHCVCRIDPTMELQVASGITKISVDEDTPESNIRTSKFVIINPSYKDDCGKSSPHDLAIIKLAAPFQMDANSQSIPIECDSSKLQTGVSLLNIGFGSEEDDTVGTLSYARQTLETNCEDAPGFLCSTSKGGQESPLQLGDSGGPLVREDADGFVQLAVNSGVGNGKSYYAPLAPSCKWLKLNL
jgi:secreted trypsin-like serine protease